MQTAPCPSRALLQNSGPSSLDWGLGTRASQPLGPEQPPNSLPVDTCPPDEPSSCLVGAPPAPPPSWLRFPPAEVLRGAPPPALTHRPLSGFAGGRVPISLDPVKDTAAALPSPDNRVCRPHRCLSTASQRIMSRLPPPSLSLPFPAVWSEREGHTF